MKYSFRLRIGRVLVFPLSFLLYQCQEDKFSFYKNSMRAHDVWRLPLIEPYEVITADCCKTWNFQKQDFQGNFTANSVNIKNGCIMFYGYPSEYGFLDIKLKRIVRFNSRLQFADSLNARGISAKLFYTEAVYNNWRETGQLPWAQDILATQKGDANSK